MPRRARKQSSTGIYHVMLRGINKQAIFHDIEDNEKFLFILSDCKAICEFELYGYCLMGNHVHLLLKEDKEKLELIFKRLGTRYVHWYNVKYIRCGHLFQDRYRSEAVENDSYFTTVLRYIHQNPIKAGLSKSIVGYAWSSYANYIGKNGFVDTEFAMSLLGEENFATFMVEDKMSIVMDENEQTKIFSDTEAIILIETVLGIAATKIINEPKDTKKNILRRALDIEGISTRQLARITGVSPNVIWKL